MILDQVIPRLTKTENPTADAPVTSLGEAMSTEALNEPVKKGSFFKRRRIKRKDSSLKSVVKAVSWRIIGSVDTIVVSFFITRRLSLAISIGGIEVFTKIILYYLHERVWMKIHF